MIRLMNVFALSVLVVTAGCLPIGDAGGRIRGEIFVDGEASQLCELILFLERDDLKVDSAFVEGAFEEEFVLAPTEMKYYVTISCPGTKHQYRSEAIKLGSIEDYRLGIDLGVIDLRSLDQTSN